jgi:hypothetical protein
MKKRLLSHSDLRDRGIRYSRRWLRELVSRGQFPVPVAENDRLYWFEHEIDRHIDSLPRARVVAPVAEIEPVPAAAERTPPPPHRRRVNGHKLEAESAPAAVAFGDDAESESESESKSESPLLRRRKRVTAKAAEGESQSAGEHDVLA